MTDGAAVVTETAKSDYPRSVVRVSETVIPPAAHTNVQDCLNRGWLSQGRYVAQFESEFADLAGTSYAIACSSGTAALHLALLALGIGPGDTVIVPALTYVATANAVRYCGADVLFADVDAETWCIDPASVNEYVGAVPSVKAIIAVHLYDATAPIERLIGYIPVVEDAAHAPGAYRYAGRPVGSLGHIAAFSFYASKVIATGEGGMVTTSNRALLDRAQLYRGQGATTPGTYHHAVVGHNYRMTDLQAAIGVAQLERIDEYVAHRRAIINTYRKRLDGLVGLQHGVPASGWACAVLLPPFVNRDQVARKLSLEGIETRPGFVPLHQLPPYASTASRHPAQRHPLTAETLARHILVLPTHCAMNTDDAHRVCDALERILR